MMKSVLISALLAAGAAGSALGQASPPAETSVTVNGKQITIKYSAPSMRGREIFGGLLPYDSVWRAGANSATSLHTTGDLMIGGLAVPKGDYTLYVWLDKNQWQLIVNKQTGQWGTEYNQAQDLGRVKMTMSKPPAPIEKYQMTLSSEGGAKASLKLAWENTIATVPITVK